MPADTVQQESRYQQILRSSKSTLVGGINPVKPKTTVPITDGFEVKDGFLSGLLPETHSIFNPLNIPEDATFYFLLYKLSKQDPEAAAALFRDVWHDVLSCLKSYAVSGAANRVSSWGAGALIALVMERFGLITQQQAAGYSMGLTIAAGTEIAQEFAELVPWKAFSSDSDYPTTLTIVEAPIEKSGGKRTIEYKGSRSGAADILKKES